VAQGVSSGISSFVRFSKDSKHESDARQIDVCLSTAIGWKACTV
jgi:hypothetical protein